MPPDSPLAPLPNCFFPLDNFPWPQKAKTCMSVKSQGREKSTNKSRLKIPPVAHVVSVTSAMAFLNGSASSKPLQNKQELRYKNFGWNYCIKRMKNVNASYRGFKNLTVSLLASSMMKVFMESLKAWFSRASSTLDKAITWRSAITWTKLEVFASVTKEPRMV